MKNIPVKKEPGSSKASKTVLTAICLSGAAALIYEIVWIRKLLFVMGSTTYAFSTMLSAFLSGLALGSFAGGNIADKEHDLNRIFAMVEIGIALSALLISPLLTMIFPLYKYLFQRLLHDLLLVTAAQFVFSFLLMMIPTTLMGCTFPLAVKIYSTKITRAGSESGTVYYWNTLGAVMGTYLPGFILIRNLGLNGTIAFAAALNVLAAFIIFRENITSVKT